MINVNTRKIVVWLFLGGTPPLIIIAFCTMVVFVLLVFVVAFASVLFGNGAQFGGGGSPDNQITIDHTWTGKENKPVVDAALFLVSHLDNCGPEMYTQCYHDMPQDLLNYWAAGCPPGSGCYNFWQSWDFQCVTFVTGVYRLAHQDLPDAPNAKDFWGYYWPGWEHVSATSMPWPGDIIVMTGPTIFAAGHVAIVVDVQPPHNGHAGYVEFAQGNAPNRLDTMALTQDQYGNLSMHIWTNYTILGYLRHIAVIH
jgi:CHAP domain